MRRLIQLALSALVLTAPVILAAEPDWILERSDRSPIALSSLNSALKTPRQFLGYPLGSRFSRHEEILGYFDTLASSSDRVTLWDYGRTYEDRRLVLVAVSSAENIARLEELRQRQLALAGPGTSSHQSLEATIEEAPICVWLAYGIHGNEASSTETAMAAAYVLAAADGSWSEKLDDVIVLIDPLANPDGRERYVHWFETTSGRKPDPNPEAAEHREPWPGGRQNHYLIDLNRDWAWLTQRETRDRLREYQRWEPHVYVDFHEMSSQSTYFFPPSAEPILPAIDPATVRWLDAFGSANARAFDDLGWTYYVGENFDLFYPGYSDSYPSLRGAIGMTYEMAGHGRAGLAIERPDNSLLTLSDRIARHLRTTLTTIETAVANRTPIIADFVAGRRRASSSKGQTYIWRADQGEARSAAELLQAHGLSVQRLAQRRELEVRPLASGNPRREEFEVGSYLLQTAQPLASLARSLMDLDAAMSPAFLDEQRHRLEQNRSTEFFDITAWSVPLAFNIEAFVAPGSVSGTAEPESRTEPIAGEGDFGYLVPPQGLSTYNFASSLLDAGIRVRLALSGLEQGSQHFPPGTLFVPTQSNSEDLDQRLGELARRVSVEISRTDTGSADSGISLGSDEVVPLRKPRIGLLGGSGTSTTSFGFLWFLLDQELKIAYSRLDLESLDRVDLAEFDVLIMPGGGYSSRLDDTMAEEIERWVGDGGILIAIGGAVSWLRDHKLAEVEEWEAPGDEDGASVMTPARRSLYTPGTAIATVVRRPHPLTVGIEGSPAMLFRGSTVLLPTGDPQRDLIVAAAEEPVVAGFAWPEAEERLRGALLMGIERQQRGAVVLFPQDPFFRLFWRAGAAPFLNALLYAPSLNEHGQLFE